MWNRSIPLCDAIQEIEENVNVVDDRTCVSVRAVVVDGLAPSLHHARR